MAGIQSRIRPPTTPDGVGLADWAEATAFLEHRKRLSRATLRQRLVNILLVEDDELDVYLDLLLAEVGKRSRQAPKIYPFERTAVGLALKEEVDQAPYEFMLWLSMSPLYKKENRIREIDELFDTLVKQALLGLLGSGSRGVRFAHPSSDGRPTAFREALKWLAGLLGLTVGAARPRPVRQDGGVDVVAWRPFKDHRPGFTMILCQSTTAKDDWPPKAGDIVEGHWLGWIDFGLLPMTALAIPHAVPLSCDRWDELRRQVNMVLDRMRIAEILNPRRIKDTAELRAWSAAERRALVV